MLIALEIATIEVSHAYMHRANGLLLKRYFIHQHMETFLGASFAAQQLALTGWFRTTSINLLSDGNTWSISCEMAVYTLSLH